MLSPYFLHNPPFFSNTLSNHPLFPLPLLFFLALLILSPYFLHNPPFFSNTLSNHPLFPLPLLFFLALLILSPYFLHNPPFFSNTLSNHPLFPLTLLFFLGLLILSPYFLHNPHFFSSNASTFFRISTVYHLVTLLFLQSYLNLAWIRCCATRGNTPSLLRPIRHSRSSIPT